MCMYTFLLCHEICAFNHKKCRAPVAARSKAWVCRRSLAGFAGSNPAWGMGICCESFVRSGRGLCFGLVTPTDCGASCVITIDNEEALAHWGAVAPWLKKPQEGMCLSKKAANDEVLLDFVACILFATATTRYSTGP